MSENENTPDATSTDATTIDESSAPHTDTLTASDPTLDQPPAYAEPARTSRRPLWLTTTRAIAAGVAAATFIIGGALGFAIGHGTAGDGQNQGPGQGQRFGGPNGGNGGGFGNGQAPGGQGQQGQQGTQQGQQTQQGPGTAS